MKPQFKLGLVTQSLTTLAAQVATFALVAALVVVFGGCSTLHRSSSSGYENRNQALGRDRQSFDRDQAARELGLQGRTSGDYGEAIDVRTRLRKAEAALEGKRERDQYFKNKPYMKSDRDRLDFLAIDSFDDRNRWLTSHGVYGTDTPNAPEIQALIDINDLTTGMTKQAVRDSWGEPELIEVAGNPLYGNERWAYSEQLPSSEGFQTEKRIVYFEGGRVSGWERH